MQGPWAGEPDVGLRPLTPVGEPLQYNYSPICGSPHLGRVSDSIVSRVCPSYPSHRGSLFMSLVVEDLFWYVLILFINGCSADICDSGVLVRGRKLRVFLLCHLAGLSYHLFFPNLM